MYDALLMPALSYAERDRLEHRLSSEEELAVIEATRELISDAAEITRRHAEIAPAAAADPSRLGPRERLRVLGYAVNGAADEVALEMLAQVVDDLPIAMESGELSVADQPDQAITQIAAFERHEDDHRGDETRGTQRPNDGPEPREAQEPGHLVGRHDQGPQHGSCRRLRCVQVSLDARQHFLQLLDRASLASKPHVGNLDSDVGTVAGEIFDQVVHLPGQTPGGEPESGEHQRHGYEDGGDPTDPPLKPGDGGCQDEGEQHGERERHEDGLRPVQDGDHKHATGERHPGLHGFPGVVQRPTPLLDRIVGR